MAIVEENITDDIYETAKLSIDFSKVKTGMPSNVKSEDMKKCKAPTLVMAAEMDCLFPAKQVIPRAEKIIDNCTTPETFSTQKDAEKRKKEIEYKMAIGKCEVPKCTTLEEFLEEYVRIYGHDKWGVSTYAGNISLINNYILPTIGKVKLSSINTHFMEKYYKDLLEMPAVKSSKIYL